MYAVFSRSRCSGHLLMILLLHGLPLRADAGEPDAERLMVRAHQARAVWEDFPGFSADVMVCTNGTVIDGEMTVTEDGDMKLKLPDSPRTEWAKRRLQSLVDHRLPREGERRFDVSFADEVTTHPLGRLIQFHDDDLHSVYRIRDDVITEVHRTMGPTRFTITVFDVFRNADGKHLPKSYSVNWWDVETGNLKACDMVRNEWVRIGRWDLPARLLSARNEDDGRRHVGEVVFRNHRLLHAASDK